MSTGKKIIFVVGATGAQGLAVIDSLLAASEDGSPSPYAVRALTRSPESRRAKELTAKGVECVKGSFLDFDIVADALQGAWGAFVNTDSFTVGEPWEIYAGMRIFELAKKAGVRHYVWSSLESAYKRSGYNPDYRVHHHDAKDRVSDWMQAQPSAVSDTEMSWSMVTTVPYMDMLNEIMFAPVSQREDGTVIFATPMGDRSMPMVALSDIGFFARHVFDNRATTSRAELKIASDMVSWEYLRKNFEKVTGKNAEVLYLSIEEWFDNLGTDWRQDQPIAAAGKVGVDTISWKDNMRAWWTMYHDGILKRDLDWIRRVNPNGHTLESWMREHKYGERLWERGTVLKNVEERMAQMTPKESK